MGKIYEHIKQYSESDVYPFHMPGHKRRKLEIFSGKHPYEVDVTEVDGLDDLNDPEEMYRESMDRMKAFYGTKETFYLVNGSTSGIMASIAATCRFGDTILISRNCHKSAYKAIQLLGLHPVYLYPQMDMETGMIIDISPEYVREVVDKHPDAKALLLVSPTYEGITMKIREIACILQEKKIPFIVDEAHGAHFPFLDEFPTSSIYLGADLVIQSMHKTMPALTQTALLHVCSELVPVNEVKEGISYFVTSSPSYLLGASIDDAFEYGVREKEEFKRYLKRLQRMRTQLKDLKNLTLLEVDDIGKLVISTAKTKMTGRQLCDILLKDYHLQMEMAQESYCLAMTSVCDTEEGFDRLVKALIEIDRTIQKEEDGMTFLPYMISNEIVYDPYEARHMPKEWMSLDKSENQISGDYIYVYPPGIPLIVPGERIGRGCMDQIKQYMKKSLNVKGIRCQSGNIYIKIIQEEKTIYIANDMI